MLLSSVSMSIYSSAGRHPLSFASPLQSPKHAFPVSRAASTFYDIPSLHQNDPVVHYEIDYKEDKLVKVESKR